MNLPAFPAIRRASVPLCAIETADPAQTIRECSRQIGKVKGDEKESPIVSWDGVNGIVGLNKSGRDFAVEVSPNGGIDSGDPREAIRILAVKGGELKKLYCFWHNAHRTIGNEIVAQGIWNLRDIFKAQGSCLILLAPNLILPSELKHDVVVITEPLPGESELEDVLKQVEKDVSGMPAIDPAIRPVIIDTLRGLSAFSAEQALAMSVKKTGIDLDTLWDRKKRMIEQTPGLQVWKGGETFDQLGGLDNLKTFLTKVLTSGKTPVRAIGFIDEIEKGLAGAGGDTSGTSQDQLQVFLKVMQDLDIPGVILVGPPGTGKSAMAKAAGNVAGAPVVAIDTGAMKGSLVGESERKIRAAMEVFKAVSQGKGLFIATCNKIASLPPELRRRFTLGTFFVDLPSLNERATIWTTWIARYKLDMEPIELGKAAHLCCDWSGAEIKACCDVAYRTGLSLWDAAAFIVPVIKSAPDQVESLRKLANGRFISASYPGLYEYGKCAAPAATGRRFETED